MGLHVGQVRQALCVHTAFLLKRRDAGVKASNIWGRVHRESGVAVLLEVADRPDPTLP